MTSNANFPSPLQPGSIRRKAVSRTNQDLIKMSHLASTTSLPLVITPNVKELDLFSWASVQKEHLETLLLEKGALLFRDFNVNSIEEFERFIKTVSGDLLEYTQRSSPRSQVAGRIYTSTDYPPDQSIFLHNENSYQSSWPLKIFFFCVTPAEQGGETPLADCRKVQARLDPKILAQFAEKGVMYVRNYGQGLGLSWQTAFQTEERAKVEEYCQKNNIQVEWRDGQRLRTRQVLPAFRKDPRTGELLWFNHATFFHASSLAPEIRKTLFAELAEEDLPTNSYYGDGSQIEASVLDELRAAYHAETISFPWQRTDILMLDNMRVAHGRNPFSGSRKVVVGMSEICSADRA